MRIRRGPAAALVGVVLLLAAATIIAGCISDETGRVVIIPQNECWSPVMSSAVGIGLSAEYSESGDVIYEWSADYGGFVLWTPEIIPCDPPCTTSETVWWTYMQEGSPMPADLPEEVRVNVKAKEAHSGKTLAETAIVLVKNDDGTYCTAE